MKSLTNLYQIGVGPSSSHTMGPQKAARLFQKAFPIADRFTAILYGSLALTGVGHGTDRVLVETFAPAPCQVEFDCVKQELPHPNTLELVAWCRGQELGRWTVLSVGGGAIHVLGQEQLELPEVYPEGSFAAIAAYCRAQNIRLWQYVEQREGEQIWDYLADVWEGMRQSIRAGLDATGELPGGLHTQRKARHLYNQRHIDESPVTRENRLVCSYAYAVSEQNAAGGTIITAPTCGSCGVVPAVLYYVAEKRGCTEREILHALAAGGVIGNLIKANASISGAECGCQAEIGSACCMAAAALGELLEMDLEQIEYAAENAMEHMLGLTCDPIAGLVQIPCIERNAVAAMRAINAVSLANFLTDTRKISFDLVVQTMYATGRDLLCKYRETGEGGLATMYPQSEKR